MINENKVLFDNPDHNYITSINANCTYQDSKNYFLGNTFFMGNCDSQESDPKMWATCIGFEYCKTFKVIKGSFKGHVGLIKGSILKGTYHLHCLKTGSKFLVTEAQLKAVL